MNTSETIYPNCYFPNVYWYLSRALLDEVNPSLRGVAFEWDKDTDIITLFFYHDGVITEKNKEHYDFICSEASAGFFFNDHLVEYGLKIISSKYPEQLPKMYHWVYRRREPFEDPT